eukprot:TRINITY_DN49343_c0_g1_i2.p1 TRINITY_DN49343_c0_g1~~TRINITY_DN49343_c0_g1_i2.p1  ORF type:complete len:641 (+),score=9.98 TRINITY_DN49343_c0_g1_i2:18-1940(+)
MSGLPLHRMLAGGVDKNGSARERCITPTIRVFEKNKTSRPPTATGASIQHYNPQGPSLPEGFSPSTQLSKNSRPRTRKRLKCVVCKQPIVHDTDCKKLPSCPHNVHKSCFVADKQSVCPVCFPTRTRRLRRTTTPEEEGTCQPPTNTQIKRRKRRDDVCIKAQEAAENVTDEQAGINNKQKPEREKAAPIRVQQFTCSTCCLDIPCTTPTFVQTHSTFLATPMAAQHCCSLCRSLLPNRCCMVLNPQQLTSNHNTSTHPTHGSTFGEAAGSSSPSSLPSLPVRPSSSASQRPPTIPQPQRIEQGDPPTQLWHPSTRTHDTNSAPTVTPLQHLQASDPKLPHRLPYLSCLGLSVNLTLSQAIPNLVEFMPLATQLTDLSVTIRLPPGGDSTGSTWMPTNLLTPNQASSQRKSTARPATATAGMTGSANLMNDMSPVASSGAFYKPINPLVELGKAIAHLPCLKYLTVIFIVETASPRGIGAFLAGVQNELNRNAGNGTGPPCAPEISVQLQFEEMNLNVEDRVVGSIATALGKVKTLVALHLENMRGRMVKRLWEGVMGLQKLGTLSTYNTLMCSSAVEALSKTLATLPQIQQLRLHAPLLSLSDTQLQTLMNAVHHTGPLLEIKQCLVMLSPKAPFKPKT